MFSIGKVGTQNEYRHCFTKKHAQVENTYEETFYTFVFKL